jgi:hypothetical protein
VAKINACNDGIVGSYVTLRYCLIGNISRWPTVPASGAALLSSSVPFTPQWITGPSEGSPPGSICCQGFYCHIPETDFRTKSLSYQIHPDFLHSGFFNNLGFGYVGD